MSQPWPQRLRATLLSADRRLVEPGPGSVQALDEIRHVGLTVFARRGERLFGAEPLVGDTVYELREQRWIEPSAQPRVGGSQITGERQQHVVADLWERRVDALLPPGPAMVYEERCTVVDQPHAPIAYEQIGVARRAVDVG